MLSILCSFFLSSFFLNFCEPYEDTYPDYQTLAQHEVVNLDYKIGVNNQNSEVSIFAIHGGHIEFGTSEIAAAIARDEFNLYRFEGIKKNDNWRLHITSDHFDEPRAVDLTRQSTRCLSIHGFAETDFSEVCIGGRNERLGMLLKESLENLGIGHVEFPCKDFPGTSTRNIVNRCNEEGVQLEISSKLRTELLNNPTQLDQLADAVSKMMVR